MCKVLKFTWTTCMHYLRTCKHTDRTVWGPNHASLGAHSGITCSSHRECHKQYHKCGFVNIHCLMMLMQFYGAEIFNKRRFRLASHFMLKLLGAWRSIFPKEVNTQTKVGYTLCSFIMLHLHTLTLLNNGHCLPQVCAVLQFTFIISVSL